MRSLPAPAIALVRRQHGVVSRTQLQRWVTAAAVDGFVRRGTLVRLERGVYRGQATACPPEQRSFAAALRAGPDAVVTGPLVLGLLGVGGFSAADPFEILTAPRRRLTGRIGFRHRRDPFPDRPVTRYGDVRVAGPVDALLESSLFLDAIDARRIRLAYDHLRWSHRLTADRLARRLEVRGGGDPAVAAFHRALDGYGLVEESEGERELGTLLGRLRPEPVPQVWVTPSRRMDWYLDELRFGWEYDGGIDHDTVVGRQRDAGRDADLAAIGVEVMHIDADDLVRPHQLVAEIVARLVVRADSLGVSPPTLTVVEGQRRR